MNSLRTFIYTMSPINVQNMRSNEAYQLGMFTRMIFEKVKFLALKNKKQGGLSKLLDVDVCTLGKN